MALVCALRGVRVERVDPATERQRGSDASQLRPVVGHGIDDAVTPVADSEALGFLAVLGGGVVAGRAVARRPVGRLGVAQHQREPGVRRGRVGGVGPLHGHSREAAVVDWQGSLHADVHARIDVHLDRRLGRRTGLGIRGGAGLRLGLRLPLPLDLDAVAVVAVGADDAGVVGGRAGRLGLAAVARGHRHEDGGNACRHDQQKQSPHGDHLLS